MSYNVLWEAIKTYSNDNLNEQELADTVGKIRNGYKGYFNHHHILMRHDLYDSMSEPENVNGMEVEVMDNDEDNTIMFLL